MSQFSTRPSHPARPSTPAAAVAAEARLAARERVRRRNRWTRAGAAVLVAVVLFAAGWVACFSDVFAVRSVQVAGVQRLDAGEVERVAEVPHGESLALLDTAPIEARIRALAPVADVDVSRKFPNTVRIQVTERTPVAVLDGPDGRRLVDVDGVAYAPAGDSGSRYLVVKTDEPALTPENLVQILAVVQGLPELIRAQVDKVEADTVQDMTVLLSDGRKIVWGGPEDPEFKTKVLEVLLRDKKTRTAKTFDVSVPEAPTVKR